MADSKSKKPKKQGFSLQGYDAKSYKQTEAYTSAIDALYNQAVQEFAALAGKVSVNPQKPFTFADYPATQAKAQQIVNQLAKKMQAVIVKGSRDQWLYACKKNDEFLKQILKTSSIPKKTLAKYQNRNLDALKAFQGRKINGLDLSKRIWNYTGQMKTQMELGIDIAVGEGKSAASLSRDLRKYLVDPDKLFHKVKDKHGNLVLSKNAKAFNPGQGKYRSSYKNAMRLTRSEINMAYRESDQLRWKQLDFVIGFEVKLSNNHTTLINGVPTPFKDICDELAGKYPKWFRFKGWHPQCYDDQSEVLTDNGWKRFEDVQNDDRVFSLNPSKRTPEWTGIRLNFRRWHKGKMVHFSNRSLDCMVTPEHEMVYLKKSNSDIERIAADEFTKGRGAFYRGCHWVGEERKTINIGSTTFPFDAFVEFMGYWLSDGSLIRNCQVKIAQQDGDKNKQNIIACIERMGLKPGGTAGSVDCYSQDLNGYLNQFGRSFDKYVPDVIKNASARQIKLFLDAFISCDGHIKKAKPFVGSRGNLCTPNNDERTYCTTSPRIASDLGEMILKIGKRPSYRTEKLAGKQHTFRNGTYTINHDSLIISECNALTATVFEKDYVDYDGYVYDLTLEKNAIMYVRRNGKCFWGSNCRCNIVPIMQPRKEMGDDMVNELKAALKGDEYKKYESPSTIRDVPDNFKKYVASKEEASKNWKSNPYWIKDNFKGGSIAGGLKVATIEPMKVVQPVIQKPTIQPLYEAVTSVEATISRNKSFETAVAFDKDGNEVFRKKGGRTSVAFTQEEVSKFKDTVFTHNHPRGWENPENSIGRVGSSFSPADIKIAIAADMAEIRACGPVFTFIMKRPKGGWPISETEFLKIQRKVDYDMQDELGSLIRNSDRAHKDKVIERANAIHYHLVWKRFCKMYGIEYTKVKNSR